MTASERANPNIIKEEGIKLFSIVENVAIFSLKRHGFSNMEE
jgi:hypothetical protein